MKKTFPALAAIVLAIGAKAQQPSSGEPFSGEIDRAEVAKVAGAVAHWQIDHFATMDDTRKYKQSDLSWANGVFLGGLADWAAFAGDAQAMKWCGEVAKRNFFQPAPNRMYHADDIAVSMLYAVMYEQNPDFKTIAPTLARLDFQINYPSKVSLLFDQPGSQDRWSWCDALYMAPPVFMRVAKIMGNERYIDHADKEFWATYDLLYDKSERLFFRDSRYFDQREANGQKIFWGRGNGWVIGGLAWILQYLPADHPSRPRYVTLFQDMCTRLASLQDKEGYWHPSLLDPASYPMPETSATALNTYALWWGINNKLLYVKKFMPAAERGWKALVRAVGADGRLGWVQPIGADPKAISADMTEVYGPGAMLLAAKQVSIYSANKK